MKHITIVAIFFIAFGCSSINEFPLESDPIVVKYFSESEVDDLSEILNFFENEICSDVSTDVNTCYDKFFKYLQGLDEISDFAGTISFIEQVQVFNNIAPDLFNEIWFFRKDFVPSLGDSLKSIHYKYPGKYFEFLHEVGDGDEAIEKYFEAFTLAADISPYLLGYAMMDSLEFNLDYERTRLIIAINYLTLNEAIRLKAQKEL